MKPLIRWYARNHQLETRRAELEDEATRLIRIADRRARQPKPMTPPPLLSSAKWLPLSDLRRAMRVRRSR